MAVKIEKTTIIGDSATYLNSIGSFKLTKWDFTGPELEQKAIDSLNNNLHITPVTVMVTGGSIKEITETTADNTQVRLDEIMNSFKQKGIHFSLDDFGTGYSNQANIIRYPYSTIKIDKSLVWASETNPKATTSIPLPIKYFLMCSFRWIPPWSQPIAIFIMSSSYRLTNY